MTSLHVLGFLNFSTPFVVETDASGVAIIARSDHQECKKLSTNERGLFTIIEEVSRWRQYLLGNHFIIRTYQKKYYKVNATSDSNVRTTIFLNKIIRI